MSGLKHLGEGIRSISGKTFEKKFVALGRLLEYWPSVIGEAFAADVQPVKIRTQKRKSEMYRILVVGVPPARSTLIHYQKGLILERIYRIMGPDFVHDIEFVESIGSAKAQAASKKEPEIMLSEEQTEGLETLLADIEDEELKASLKNLGKSVLKEHEKHNQGS
ncbi:MAG: DciA family protein [Pseudobdellovibrionaceae bacterium]